jgi:alpha-beta hydrolase superfamily lysophospholipase
MLVDLVQVWTRDGLRLDGAFQVASVAPALPVDALCFVHGTGGNFYGSTLFDAVAERLLALGCAVLRVNTRAHDLMSNAALAQGGRRQGAAYEVVDDCRHDLTAWLDWLRQRAGPRVGLLGHSLGAVKCLYAAAHDAGLGAACVAAVSPPQLSYSWFLAGPEGPQFRAAYEEAERLAAGGRPTALLEVRLPLPMAITAAGYLEKYGPDERHNYLRFVERTPCPTLVTLGGDEVQNNMAFRGAPEELQALAARRGRLRVEVIAEADHFYSKQRQELGDCVIDWLRKSLGGG